MCYWQSLGLAMIVRSGLPSSTTENTSSSTKVIAGTSHPTVVPSPAPLYCTYPFCTAKEEGKVFTGKGSTSAHKYVSFNMRDLVLRYVLPNVYSLSDSLINH